MSTIQVIPAVPSPKTAYITEHQRERNRNKNRHLEPDYLSQEDTAMANSDADDYEFYDANALKNKLCEDAEFDAEYNKNDDLIEALLPKLAGKSIEEVCIYCLVIVDKITGEEIGNALKTSREMARIRFHQIADKMREDDAALLYDVGNSELIKNVVYSSAQEKLAYLYALHNKTQKSTRGRQKASKTSMEQKTALDLFGGAA